MLRGEEQFSLSRRLLIPKLIGTDSLKESLRSDARLPSRFRIYAASESGLRIPLASLTRLPRGDEFEVRRLESDSALRELPWDSRVQLVASDGANHVATAPLPGGDPLADLPMVFVETDEAGTYRFIRSGRTRIPADECHVLAFGDTNFAVDADSDADRIGYLEAPEAEVYLVTGRAQVDFPSGSCSIRTRESATDEEEYVLYGSTRQPGPRGTDVFLGLPRVEQVLPDGPRMDVSPDDIQWRPARLTTAPWRSARVAAVGDVVMRVQHEGETVFSTRATVFPPDFDFRMHVGVGEGRIEMSGLQAEDVAVEGAFDHEPSCEPGPGDRWTVAFGGETPESGVCDVHVRFQAGRSHVSATVPVAARRFVTASGRALAPGQRVTVDDLPGIWAEVLSPDDLAEWDLEVWGGGRPTIEGRLPRDASGVHRLPLDGLGDLARARLSMLSRIDETVDMRLERANFPMGAPHTEIAVGRYNSEFERLEPSDEGWVAALAGSSALAADASRVERLSVEAHRLWAPQLDPVVASSAGTGRWVFEGALEEGMWIVVGRLGATCAVRPQLLVSGQPWDNEWSCEFTSAVSARHADLDERLEALLAKLEQDALHPAWEPFLEAIASTNWLPVTTHRCVVLAIRRPRLMAICAMRMALRPTFSAFWTAVEDLPFAWSLVGLDDWADAADDFAASLCSAEELPDEVRETVTLAGMTTVMDAIRGRYVAFSTIQELMAHEGLPVPRPGGEALPTPEALPRRAAMRKMMIESDREQLHRFHHQDWWPQAHVTGFPQELEETAGVPDDVWIASPSSWQDDVANAPVVAAAICAGSKRPALKLIGELKRLRAFDAEWFDEAHAATLASLLDPRLVNEE